MKKIRVIWTNKDGVIKAIYEQELKFVSKGNLSKGISDCIGYVLEKKDKEDVVLLDVVD